MFINFNKIIFLLVITTSGLNAFALEIAPELQSFFNEEQLNKFTSMGSPANIHINVDAKSYINNYNSNNTRNNKSNNQKTNTKNNNVTEANSNHIEIKNNKESTIASDVTKDKKINSENKESQITAPTLSEVKAAEPVAIETKTEVQNIETPAIEPVQEIVEAPKAVPVEKSVEDSFAEEVTTPAAPEAVVVTPVEMSPEIIISAPVSAEPVSEPTIESTVESAVDSTVEPVLEPITDSIQPELAVDEVAPAAAPEALASNSSRFSIRGFYNFGTFTSISDISSNYSLGLALGYDLNPSMRIEFQYSFSEYEDGYDYSYSALVSGYKFDQNDFAAILNYKVIKNKDYNVYARGGLNYSSRSAHNFYTGDTNSSSSFGVVIGAGADYRVAKNLSITGNLDYIFSLSSSGYNDIASPLFLVENENFLNFSFGLKFDF